MTKHSIFTIIFFCFLGLLYSQSLHAETKNTAYGDIKLYQVKKIKSNNSITIAGTVAANKSAQLTAQIPGRILSITGQEGDRYYKGTKLLRIDDSALKAKLDAAYAQREAAVAAIRNARVQLHREVSSPRSSSTGSAPGGMAMPSMMDQMFFSPMQSGMGMRDRDMERNSDIISRETQVASANTKLKQADAQIKEIQANLRDAYSQAPFDGVIEKVFVEVGDTVQPGMPLIKFSATAGYKVEVDIPARLIDNLRDKMSISVRLDGKDKKIQGHISRIFPVANAQDHTVRIEITLPSNITATAGMYSEVFVQDNGSQVSKQLVVPDSSIIMKSGIALIHVVSDEGKNRLKIVRLGSKLANGDVVILSGVKENERIIINPPPGLKSGSQIIQPAS